jgi:hypothetical protein
MNPGMVTGLAAPACAGVKQCCCRAAALSRGPPLRAPAVRGPGDAEAPPAGPGPRCAAGARFISGRLAALVPPPDGAKVHDLPGDREGGGDMDDADIELIIMRNARLEYEHARTMAARERDRAQAAEQAAERPARQAAQPPRHAVELARGVCGSC